MEQGSAVEVIAHLHRHTVAVGAGDQAVLAVVEVGLLLAGGVYNGTDLPGHIVLILGGVTFAVGGAGHVASKVIGIGFGAFVRFQDADNPAPLVQTVAGAVVVAVHYAHNVAPGVVFQLLGRAAVFLRAQEFLIVNHWIIW